jgi:hypothetical protein
MKIQTATPAVVTTKAPKKPLDSASAMGNDTKASNKPTGPAPIGKSGTTPKDKKS